MRSKRVGASWLISGALVFLLTVLLPAKLMASGRKDPTADTLDRCLNDPANGSTAGQTECERLAPKVLALAIAQLPAGEPQVGQQAREARSARQCQQLKLGLRHGVSQHP